MSVDAHPPLIRVVVSESDGMSPGFILCRSKVRTTDGLRREVVVRLLAGQEAMKREGSRWSEAAAVQEYLHTRWLEATDRSKNLATHLACPNAIDIDSDSDIHKSVRYGKLNRTSSGDCTALCHSL